MFPFSFFLPGIKVDPEIGPVRQTKLAAKKIVISTVHNGGMPFEWGGKKPNGNYETALMTFDSPEDMTKRLYKTIELLANYKTKEAAIEGHEKFVRRYTDK